MKKAGVFLVILILFSVSVSAFGLSDILKLFSGSEPVVINTQANPIKVYPGQSLQNLVAFEDSCGIESATAYFPYEGGYDKVEMILSAGDSKKGTYSASWVVHNTLNMKWYKTRIVLTSSCGGQTIAYVDWQDPTQDHPLEQLRSGVSQDANTDSYRFWGSNTPAFRGALEGFAINNGISNNNYGVYGYTNSTGANCAGVRGDGNIGVYARGTVYGVLGYATASNGYSGYFTGGKGIYVIGNLSSTTGFAEHGCVTTGEVSGMARCDPGYYLAGIDCDSGGDCARVCCLP